MLNLRKHFLVFFLITLTSSMLSAEEVTVAFAPHKPPYIIENENRGLEIDIVKEALALQGHTLRTDFFYRPVLGNAIKYGRTEAAAGLTEGIEGLYYSDSHISFQNTIISHAADQIVLNSLSDLNDYRYAAWEEAHKVLGDEYRLVTEDGKSPTYLEYSNHLVENKMFWSNRLDLIIIDRLVFNWYRDELAQDFITTTGIVEHSLLPESTHYKIAFRDAAIRDSFNLGLAELKRTGRYQALKDHYFAEERASLPHPVYLHYDKRSPYLNTGNSGVFGLAASPARNAFKTSGIRFSWKQTPKSQQLALLKKNSGNDCLVGWHDKGKPVSYAKYTYPIYTDRPLVALTLETQPIEADTLAELFGDSKKVMLVKEAYSNGSYIDLMVKKLKPKRLIMAIEQSDLLMALKDGKADYMLIAPENAGNALRDAGLMPSDFKVHVLKDIPAGDQYYMLCSNRVSDQVIDKLNAAISQKTSQLLQ